MRLDGARKYGGAKCVAVKAIQRIESEIRYIEESTQYALYHFHGCESPDTDTVVAKTDACSEGGNSHR